MAVAGLALILGMAAAGPSGEAGVPVVEPAALGRDSNLIGREVIVDDRVRFFQSHRKGGREVFDELLLKRTDVVFKLPPDLRPDRPPRQPSARVRGILRAEGKQISCDVLALDLFPADLERLDREVRRLAPGDAAGRLAWATWAERRGADFKDAELSARGKAIEAEALLLDAGRPGADDLALARRARARGLEPAIASGLAYRGLRARLDRAATADELARLAADVESFLPRAVDPKAAADVGAWRAGLKADPVAVYRQVAEPTRAAIDRDLLAEVVRLGIERRLAAAPGDAAALAEEARARLPDRPEIAARIRERGLSTSEGNVAQMRLSEVEALARTFRDDGQPGRAADLLKKWLDDQRRRINPRDADGLIALAGHYVRLLDDRAVAADLLHDALKAEPESTAAADAFRRMNFRKSPEGRWFDPKPGRGEAATGAQQPADAPPARDASGSWRGLSIEQVRSRLGGKPDRIARSATQDETVEQWIYQGPRGMQVVNIRRPRGSARPEVLSYYSIP